MAIRDEETYLVNGAEVNDALDLKSDSPTPSDAVADPASPGVAYDQAEAVAVRDAVVAALDVLREQGLLAEA